MRRCRAPQRGRARRSPAPTSQAPAPTDLHTRSMGIGWADIHRLRPESPLLQFMLSVAAWRLRGSLSKSVRCSVVHTSAPCRHAHDSGTMWSICTRRYVSAPKMNAKSSPLCGSVSAPASTLQPLVSAFSSSSVRSQRRMSLRVSQPLRSASAHRCPDRSQS